MTLITGNIADTGKTPFGATLTVTLDAPLLDGSTLLIEKSKVITIPSTGVINFTLTESETSQITYLFELKVGDDYVIEPFHAVVPNVSTVNFWELLPVSALTDLLPAGLRRIAQIIATDPTYSDAVKPFTPRGEWESTALYSRGDLVEYDGSGYSYTHPTITQGKQPNLYNGDINGNTIYWQTIARRGLPGETLVSVVQFLMDLAGTQTVTGSKTFNATIQAANALALAARSLETDISEISFTSNSGTRYWSLVKTSTKKLEIRSYDSTGALLRTPIQIDPLTGEVVASGALSAETFTARSSALIGSDLGTGSKLTINGASGASKEIRFQSAGVNRWAIVSDNTGSSLVVQAYDDAGTLIDLPISIARTVGGSITVTRPVTIPSLTLGTALAITNGGTGANTLAGAKTALGITDATSASFNANKLQGKAISTTAPIDKQYLKYDLASNSWLPTSESNVDVGSTQTITGAKTFSNSFFISSITGNGNTESNPREFGILGGTAARFWFFDTANCIGYAWGRQMYWRAYEGIALFGAAAGNISATAVNKSGLGAADNCVNIYGSSTSHASLLNLAGITGQTNPFVIGSVNGVQKFSINADGGMTLGTPLAIASGGTGGNSASAARTALGVDPATAQYNANKLQGKAIDATAPAANQALVYDSVSQTYKPQYVGGGKVLQVAYATTSTQVSNSTTTYAETGLSATITPQFSTSKILVFVNIPVMQKSGGDTWFVLQAKRGSTVINSPFSIGVGYNQSTTSTVSSTSHTIQDSPATTSATTYTVQFKNGASPGLVEMQNNSSPSSLMLMEIAA